MIKKLILSFLIILLSTLSFSEDSPEEEYNRYDYYLVRWSWTRATYGTPAILYIFQISKDFGPFETITTSQDTTVTIQMRLYHTYVARVAGVDAQGQQGNWSPPSIEYYIPNSNGPPMEPLNVMLK